MRERQAITEELGIHRQWYEQAKEQTLATLPEFMRRLSEDYGHDYGTICHAIAASALAAAYAFDRGPSGGITGFQAGAIMWEFITHWNGVEGPARLVKYADMLYPQYADHFAKTITPYTAEWLKAEAAKHLADHADGLMSPRVKRHLESVAAGVIPFGYSVADT